MRKFFFLTTLLIALLGIKAQLFAVGIGTATLDIQNVDPVYEEQVITVPISAFNFNNVGNFQLNVAFDISKLELVQEPNGTPLGGQTIFSNTLSNANATGHVIIQWNYSGTAGQELNFPNGTLIGLKFYVKPSTESITTAVTLSGTTAVTFSGTQTVQNPLAQNILLGTTDGDVKIFAKITPNILLRANSVNNHILEVYCQHVNSIAGFEVRVNYSNVTYPGVTTSNITFPNAGITGATLNVTPTQIFLGWVYSGDPLNSVTLGSGGNGVLAQIDMGRVVTPSDFAVFSAGVNTISNAEMLMTAIPVPNQIATFDLGYVLAGNEHTLINVPVNVTNFNNVGNFQFTIAFDNTKLELAVEPNGTMIGGQPLFSNTLATANSSGQLTLQWNYSGTAGTELNFPDGQLLALTFLVKGTAAGQTFLTFPSTAVVQNPLAQSILQAGYPSRGEVIFQRTVVPEFVLGTPTFLPNNKVNVPLSVNNFNSVAGFEVRITIPANFTITPSDITTTGSWIYNGMTIGVSGGQVIIAWVYDGTVAHLATLADGTIINQLQFTYTGTGSATAVPLVFFSAATNDINGNQYTATTSNAAINVPIRVSAKVFLEGPYTGSSAMSTNLRSLGYIPLTQPYSAAPFNYAGTEVVGTIPAGVVDWVLVELRTGTAGASTVARRAAFLLNTGSVVDIDGISPVAFPTLTTNANYYIVIRHRNHLAAMSATNPLLQNTNSLYDFSTVGQFFGATGEKNLGLSGVYGMFAGDGNGDGSVDYTNDILALWFPNFGVGGYMKADFNLNGTVDYPGDVLTCWQPNFGFATQVPALPVHSTHILLNDK